MSRIIFPKGEQTIFINNLLERKRLKINDLANICKVSSRTIRDWRREKFKLSKDALEVCVSLTEGGVKVPQYTELPDFWSIPKAAKKGGLTTSLRYGGPGTPEGRKRGGTISQERRRLYPELYRNCNLRKIISKPKDKMLLAEFIGIMLGDGSMPKRGSQAVITLHKEDSKEYISMVSRMIKDLFSIEPAIYYYNTWPRENVASITISSTSFIDFLIAKGLKRGHKVRQQVDVPKWIKANKKFSIACLRGLIDTDGCIYSHSHKVLGYDYFNIGINFSNRSTPILKFVYKTLKDLNFSPKIFKNGVNLYRKAEVCRYAEEIKFRNPYYQNRLSNFLNKQTTWKGV